MKLSAIIELLGLPRACAELEDLEIEHVCAHSSECTPSSIFVCIDGHRDSGERHLAEAVARGVRVIIVSKKQQINRKIHQIISNNTRKCGAEITRLVYKELFDSLRFVFITGTKGKTTTAKMLAHLLTKAGIATATVGTLGIEFGSYQRGSFNTTPDFFALLPQLNAVHQMGAELVVLEVSSQALKDERICGFTGEMAIFTGLSEDHIDPNEHPTFQDYALSKRRLFSEYGVQTAFAPLSCGAAGWMLDGVSTRYFADTRRASDLTLQILQMSKSGTLFTDGKEGGFLSMYGEFNLKNAALAVLCAAGITGKPCAFFYPFLSEIRVMGRLECLRILGREVVIDYAHNAESVKEIGLLFRKLTKGRLVAVIGSVGDRARGRRRELARTCEKVFDYTIFTEDDTVFESSKEIVEELFSYICDSSRAKCVLPRERAIAEAFGYALREDTVLLLGKGHERRILRDGVSIPFCEREILEQIQEGKYGKI